MKIIVRAKPKSKKEFIKRLGETSFVVAVKELPEKGKANQAIIKALAKVLNVPLSSIILVSGQASKQKLFEIPLTLEELKSIPEVPVQIKLEL